jgi:DNA-binding LacI/PurR family transcriptional regulator
MKSAILKKDQIYEKLKKDIIEKKYPDGFQLPHELDFAKQLGVGKVTLRSALNRLEEEMLIFRLRGKGTFVKNAVNSGHSRNVMIIASEEYLKRPNSTYLYLLSEFSRMADRFEYGEINVATEQVKLMSKHDLHKATKKNNVKAIFLFGHIFTGKEKFLEHLKATGCPIILPHALQDDYIITGCAAVTIKMKDSWKNAIKYLTRLGHCRIATIALTSRYDEIMEMCPKELLHELTKHGAYASAEYIKSVPYQKHAIEKVINGWLELPRPPTAIMVGSTIIAQIIYSIIKQNGLLIPDDISVVSLSRQRENLLFNPHLTSVNVDYRGIAAKAYKLLNDSPKWFPLAKDKEPPNLFHYYPLEEGASTRAVCKQEEYELSFI